MIFGLFFLAKAYGLGFGVLAVAWIRSLTMIVLLLPVTVGNIGIREASFVTCMQLYGVSGSQAMVVGLTISAIQLFNGFIGAILDLLPSRNSTALLDDA